MADELIYFRAPSSLVIAMTLPLHEAIEHQWRTGELQRVNADGSRWEGDDELPPEPEDDNLAHEGTVPDRPRANAHVDKWRLYAVAIRATSEAKAAEMTRDELRDLCTPPEEKPDPV